MSDNAGFPPTPCSRRQFVQGVAATFSTAALAPSMARAEDKGKIALGFIGSGSRATWVATPPTGNAW